MKVQTRGVVGRDDKKTPRTKKAKQKGGKVSSQVRFICQSPFEEPQCEAMNESGPPHIPSSAHRLEAGKVHQNEKNIIIYTITTKSIDAINKQYVNKTAFQLPISGKHMLL